jgi:CubicO group peptidase (beta-lactamase class C family)
MPDAAHWTARLHELARRARVPGAVLGIWSDGQEILAAHGVLNSATKVPVTTDSLYVLLGRIIEVLDGQSWDQSLRDRLTGPLSATRTITLPEEAILHRAAVGHHRCRTPVRVWGLPRSIGPAGLISAAAGDLLAFARLHLDGGITTEGKRLVTEASAAAMRSPCAAIPDFSAPGAAIGLGWRVIRWGDRTAWMDH